MRISGNKLVSRMLRPNLEYGSQIPMTKMFWRNRLYRYVDLLLCQLIPFAKDVIGYIPVEEEGVIILPVSPTELYRSEPLKTGYIRTKKKKMTRLTVGSLNATPIQGVCDCSLRRKKVQMSNCIFCGIYGIYITKYLSLQTNIADL